MYFSKSLGFFLYTKKRNYTNKWFKYLIYEQVAYEAHSIYSLRYQLIVIYLTPSIKGYGLVLFVIKMIVLFVEWKLFDLVKTKALLATIYSVDHAYLDK